MSKEIELAEVFQDMEPNESMRDFAIRKSLEAKRSTDKVANLRDWIHQIAVNAGNEQFVIDATSSALCGEDCNKQTPFKFYPTN